jgi:hypothetical protein
MADNKPPVDDDDDAELELAPIDPEILAHEQQRAKRLTDSVIDKVDVDELYGESPHTDLGVDISSLKQFRFTTRHLLIATALLALVMTVFTTTGACNAIFWIAVATLGAGWFWVLQQERRREIERQRRREEFLAGVKKTPTVTAFERDATEGADQPQKRFDVKFAFSPKEMALAMTVAVVVVGLLWLMGPHNLAYVLGLIAIAGIIANIVGLDAAPIVVLGWWLLLVLYLVVSLVAMFTDSKDDDAAAQATVASTQRVFLSNEDSRGATLHRGEPWSVNSSAPADRSSAARALS